MQVHSPPSDKAFSRVRLIVIPLRGFLSAKERLREHMPDDARFTLVREMATHVVQTAMEVGPTAVLSRDKEIWSFARNLGAAVLEEPLSIGTHQATNPQHTLNQGLDWASGIANVTGATVLGILFADLPLLTAEDVEELLAVDEDQVHLAPDKSGQGTNALATSLPLGFPLSFGQGSFTRHREAALSASLTVRTLERPGLAFDIDTPADLNSLESLRAEKKHTTNPQHSNHKSNHKNEKPEKGDPPL